MRVKISMSMFLSMMLAWLIALPLSLLGGHLLGTVLYEYQMSRVEDGPGSIGTAALEDTPIATSITDIKKLDRFTLMVDRDHMTRKMLDDVLKLDGKVFYTVDLPSGERVAALINFDAITSLSEGGALFEPNALLPVGKWVKWKHSGDAKRLYKHYEGLYTDFSHYVDMSSSESRMPDLIGVRGATAIRLFVVLLIFFIWLIRHLGVKWGFFEPEDFKSKARSVAGETIPLDDTERWFVASYAIWAARCGTADLISGRMKTSASKEFILGILNREWGINNARDGLDTISKLIDPAGYSGLDKPSLAWDYGRAMQLLGNFYLMGYIDRQQMRTRSCQIGRLIQSRFSSWEDLCTNYLEGFMQWRQTVGPGAAWQLKRRTKIYLRLKRQRNSPYRLSFYLPLCETTLSSYQTY